MNAIVDPVAGAKPADLAAAAEADFDALPGAPRRHRRVHRPDPERSAVGSSRRVPVEGPPPARDAAVGGDALGHPAPMAALRRPLRAVGGTHRAAGLRHAGRPQRGSPGAPRGRWRSPVRLPGRRALGADLGGPADIPPSRRAARSRRDGRQDPLLQGQHRAVRPRPAVRGRPGARAQDGRRRGGQGLRRRGRGRAHAGRHARDTQLRVWPRAVEPRPPDRLERLRDRRPAGLQRRLRRTRGLGRAARLARRRDPGRDVLGPGDADRARRRPRREPRSTAVRGLVPDPEGPRLRQGGRRVARHAASPQQPGLLGRSPSLHGALRRHLRGRRPARPGRSGRPGGPGGSQPRHRHVRPAPGSGARDLAVGPAAGDRRHGARRDPRGPPRATRRAPRSSPTRGSPTRAPIRPPCSRRPASAPPTGPPWAPGAPG